MEVNKQIAFLNYAKSKKWDASLCLYNGKYIAILNPVDDKTIYEGQSEISIGDAIDICKQELIKKKKG